MLIKEDPDTILGYLEDSSNLKGGRADRVVIPENIEELSASLKEANAKKIPVTISGGGTGTTGSRVPFGGIVISMERFNGILKISKEDISCAAETGVMVEDLKNACEKKGLFYTSHPTEKTASIGGTVSTNASGSRSFKYGPTRKYVKRLKMALPSGEIFDLKRGEKILTRKNSRVSLKNGQKIDIPIPGYKMPKVKNAAGYFAKDGMDLIDLFIGQEGTLSVIVEIEMGLVNLPSKILSAFVFFKAEEDSWDFSRDAKKSGQGALSIEYFDNNALRLLREKNSNVPPGAHAAIFFEQETAGNGEDDALGGWLGLISKSGVSLDDTWVAMNEREADKFTSLRHSIPEAMNEMIKRNGFQKISTDMAVPDDGFIEMMNFYADTLTGTDIEHYIFGHIGECHLHVNMIPKSEGELSKAMDICLRFAEKSISLGGTISAEHGIGKIKHRYLEMMYGRKGIIEMARIKKAIDPNCILGLDNIFSKEILSEV